MFFKFKLKPDQIKEIVEQYFSPIMSEDSESES